MMTNAGLQEYINKYGNDIIAIGLNNGKNLKLNYDSLRCPKTSDISFETVGGCDMFKVKHIDTTNNNIYYTSHVTEFVEYVAVTENKGDYIDPRIFN